jgi:putative phage-type endonuclease
MEQGSKEWFEQRKGRFTASKISHLLGIKGLNKMGDTYAYDKAVELVYGLSDEELNTPDVRRGNELEPIAFDLFTQHMGLQFVEVKKSEFFPYGENAGASPDGLVGEDAILEIKCPRHDKFFRIVKGGIKEVDKVYIDQMQKQMLSTNSNNGYMVNFVIYNGKPLMNIIEVERDEERIKLIKERIIEATKLRDEYVQYLLNSEEVIRFNDFEYRMNEEPSNN